MVTSACKADKYVFYQQSVQDASAEEAFFSRVYKNIRRKEPRVLREDFCGTAQVACEWVRRGKERIAYGIDLDMPTLDWGKEHNVSTLGEDAHRVTLVNGNVLDPHPFKADVVAALNFSYFIFKDRATLIEYARCAHKSLAEDGLFILDIFGGPDSQVVQEEGTDHGDFVYIWDQAHFNPITNEIQCYIHFDLPDGKRMKRVFSYDWRLWSIPEMKDVLKEAGFSDVHVYWEGTDQKTQRGNSIFRRSNKGDDSSSWIAYIVAEK